MPGEEAGSIQEMLVQEAQTTDSIERLQDLAGSINTAVSEAAKKRLAELSS